jgi:hypothetical protein
VVKIIEYNSYFSTDHSYSIVGFYGRLGLGVAMVFSLLYSCSAPSLVFLDILHLSLGWIRVRSNVGLALTIHCKVEMARLS